MQTVKVELATIEASRMSYQMLQSPNQQVYPSQDQSQAQNPINGRNSKVGQSHDSLNTDQSLNDRLATDGVIIPVNESIKVQTAEFPGDYQPNNQYSIQASEERKVRKMASARPLDHPQNEDRERTYQMAYDAAAMIEARAKSIKEEIEKTKNDMCLGNDFVAQGRSRQAEQSKFMSMKEVARRKNSMYQDPSPQRSSILNGSQHGGNSLNHQQSVQSFSPPPNMASPKKQATLSITSAHDNYQPLPQMSPYGAKTMKHSNLKGLQIDSSMISPLANSLEFQNQQSIPGQKELSVANYSMMSPKSYIGYGEDDTPALPMMQPQMGFGGVYQEQALPRASRRLVAAGQNFMQQPSAAGQNYLQPMEAQTPKRTHGKYGKPSLLKQSEIKPENRSPNRVEQRNNAYQQNLTSPRADYQMQQNNNMHQYGASMMQQHNHFMGQMAHNQQIEKKRKSIVRFDESHLQSSLTQPHQSLQHARRSAFNVSITRDDSVLTDKQVRPNQMLVNSGGFDLQNLNVSLDMQRQRSQNPNNSYHQSQQHLPHQGYQQQQQHAYPQHNFYDDNNNASAFQSNYPAIPTLAMQHDNLQLRQSMGSNAVQPIHEQAMRMSQYYVPGQGQDDSMPNVPTMSIEAAQQDISIETQRAMNGHGHQIRDTMTPVMFVSKDHNVQADIYIESDAEEIYMPYGGGRKTGGFNNKVSTTTEDDSGIIGYQKYLHIVNRLAVDNTDAQEPRLPELSQFLRVSAQDDESEVAKQVENYKLMRQQRRSGQGNNQDSLMERTDEESSSYDSQDEKINAEDEERMKKFSKFNFSGMSFKDYVGSIQTNLNVAMKQIVQNFTQQKLTRHHSMHLSQRKVQVKHPIFRLISINAFKFIIDRAYLFKLKLGQTAYKEDKTAMKNVYFVLYGAFDYQKGQANFGERVELGWTIGEEIMFSKADPVKRLETVVATSEACLLQLKVTDLESMAKPNKMQAAGSSFKQDYDILMSFLASNYETKQSWRKDVGVINSPRVTRNKFGNTFKSKGTTTEALSPTLKHPQDSHMKFF